MKIIYGMIVPSELELVNRMSEIKTFLDKEYNTNIYFNIWNSDTDIIGVEIFNTDDIYLKLDINLMNECPSKYHVLFEKMFGFILNIWTEKIQEKTKIYMEQNLDSTEIDKKMESLILPTSLDVDWYISNE